MVDSNQSMRPLRIDPLGNSLSLLMQISYLPCVGFGAEGYMDSLPSQKELKEPA